MSKELVSRKEIACDWGVTTRTVHNHLKKYKKKPAGFIGLMAYFTVQDVADVKNRVFALRLKQLGYN